MAPEEDYGKVDEIIEIKSAVGPHHGGIAGVDLRAEDAVPVLRARLRVLWLNHVHLARGDEAEEPFDILLREIICPGRRLQLAEDGSHEDFLVMLVKEHEVAPEPDAAALAPDDPEAE